MQLQKTDYKNSDGYHLPCRTYNFFQVWYYTEKTITADLSYAKFEFIWCIFWDLSCDLFEYLFLSFIIMIIIIIYSLTKRIVGAPQMILQPVSFIFPCSPLPSVTWQTPGLSIPWCCLPTSSSVCLLFFPLSLCLARWFWPDLMNGRQDYTIAVCVSLRSSLYEMRSILR